MKKAFYLLIVMASVFGCGFASGQILRSGAEPDYPPLSIVQTNGAADGFAVEMLKASLTEVGLKASFEIAPWDQLKAELAEGALDVLPLVGRTPEREALFDFTVPYLTLHGALFVREDETAIQSLADLPGKTIAVMKGDNAEEYVLRANLSERVVSTVTFEEAFRMLSRGDADAVIAQKLMGVTLLNNLGIANVKVTGQPNQEFKQQFCFGVQKGNSALLSILNEGLALTVQSGTQQRLKQKWLGTPFYEAALARPLIYGGDRAFPPFEYLDEKGRPAGFNIELARALARELGVEISFRLEPWSEIRRKMDAGSIDLAAMLYLESRDRTADFSSPLAVSAQAVFAGKNSPLYTGPDSLRGKRISVQDGDLMHDYLLKNGFSSELIVTRTPQEALRMLADGEVDFSVSSLLQGRYWIEQNGWHHLLTVDQRLFATDYCFAVPQGNTALLRRINEGLTLLKESGEYQDIYDKWLGVLDTGIRWEKLRRIALTVGGALVLTAAAVLWFIFLLRRQVRKKTAELRAANHALEEAKNEALERMQEAIRVSEKLELTQFALDNSTDTVFWIASDGRFTFVNKAACEQLGYTNEALLTMKVSDIDPDFPPEHWPEHWQEMKAGGTLRFESHHQTKDGRIFPVEIYGSFLAHGDEEYIFAFVHDITERKQQQHELEKANARLEANNRELQSARQAALNMMEDTLRDKERLEQSAQVQRAVINVLHTPISNVQKFLDEALNEAISLTGSKIGYIYFYDEQEKQFILNSWSKDVMPHCRVANPQTCYELDKTGIWGEAVRQRRPILLNNFQADHPHKKGLPKDHVELRSFLTVPVFENEQIVAVVGVANKASDYDQQDILTLQLFMDSVWVTTRDIKARQAIQESEENLRITLNSIGDAVISTDTNGRVVSMNPIAESLTGWTNADAVGKPLDEVFVIINEQTRETVESPVDNLLKTGQIIGLANPTLLISKDGRETPIADSGAPIKNTDGETTGVVLVFRDQTKERTARQALEASETRFRSLFQNMPAGFALHEMIYNENGEAVDYRFLQVNPAFEEMTGLNGKNVLGRTINEVIPNTEPVWLETYAGVVETGRPANIEDFAASLNKYFSVRAFCPAPGQFATVFYDITKRRLAEAELQRLSIAIEQTPEIVVITDKNGTIQYVNPAFEKITGYTREEAIGQNPRILKSGQHDDRFYKEMWETLKAGEIWRGQIVNKRKNGSPYTEAALISPVRNSSGNTTHFVAVKRDITDDLVKEEKFRQSQKMEAIGQLAGGVAYDFNNILQAILGFSDLLAEKLADESQEQLYVKEIRKSAKRAAELTRQLLAFSRKQPVEKTEIDLNTTIQDTEVLLKLLLGNEIHYVFDPDPDLTMVYVDQSQITQIIMNLAVNARDAMPNGGRLTISTRNVTLDPQAAETMPEAEPGTFVCLSVTDTGCGMSKEAKDHLFEPFFTTKDVGRGTGLGLAVIYGIVKQNKGWIHVDSEENQGTSFNIYLPAGESSAQNKSTHPEHHERILLVEDSQEMMDMVIRILDTASYETVAVKSAEEALQVFKKENGRFDLLFSDMALPGKCGLELADALRKLQSDLPVLLYSGYQDQRNRWINLESKGYHFLQKPFTLTGLLAAVHDAIAEKPR